VRSLFFLAVRISRFFTFLPRVPAPPFEMLPTDDQFLRRIIAVRGPPDFPVVKAPLQNQRGLIDFRLWSPPDGWLFFVMTRSKFRLFRPPDVIVPPNSLSFYSRPPPRLPSQFEDLHSFPYSATSFLIVYPGFVRVVVTFSFLSEAPQLRSSCLSQVGLA